MIIKLEKKQANQVQIHLKDVRLNKIIKKQIENILNHKNCRLCQKKFDVKSV